MSEDLVQSAAHKLGRYAYLRLGSTTLRQLQRSKYIRGKLSGADEKRKPDGIVFLPRGGIKAVVEVKQPKELIVTKLDAVIKHYCPIARAVCNVLIITDGKQSFWINPHTGKPILDESGKPIKETFDCQKIEGSKLQTEIADRLVSLVEQASHCVSPNNDALLPLKIVDPTGLAKTVWQKIWINTGKEPEKCLYNVVEIFLFKFLSDNGVLTGNYSFQRVIELLSQSDIDALNHYANISRKKIADLFPEGDDGTTVINGTIFVNEKGEPNMSQAGLFAEVILQFQGFDDEYGSMRNIGREFKTRLYESFLRQEAGVKSLGQYFTPRNVVRAIVAMSNASALQDGARICDPFCGVGGFLLEAIVENEDNIGNQYLPKNGKVNPKIIIKGYDKGTDEKEDERTIILAKANMLIYFSNILALYNSDSHLAEFSRKAFNAVFELIRTNLGSFGKWDDDPYDLILTNPPYVTSGSASLKNAIEAAGLEDKFLPLGRGTEALAIQWIVANLKPGGEALVVVPDGLLNQRAILEFLMQHCYVRGIVALPSRTFYSTPKKTYVLALNRKPPNHVTQTDPVFAFFVSEIGESRDARRIQIPQNDLTEAALLFRQFNSARSAFSSKNPRCKIIPFGEIKDSRNWLVDRLWTKAERAALGVQDDLVEVDEEGFVELVKEAAVQIQTFLSVYNAPN
jgi:type I restriction-modification system DNA methylase subunit